MSSVALLFQLLLFSAFLFIDGFRSGFVGTRSWFSRQQYRLESTSQSGSSSTGSSSVKLEELQQLLKEVLEIATSTGLRAGVSRTIQGARALNKLASEFASSQQSFMDVSTGKLSVPRVVRRLFEELGATYIKLGQFIASSPTLFPADYVLEFQACLDNSPKIPFSEIKQIIQDDLDKPITAVYQYVNPTPLASASIAQVHRARLRNGTEVVIKVRKPTVEVTLKADLGFLLITSKIIEFVNPSLSRLSLSNIVGDIRESMLDELDFRKEASNLVNFRDFLTRNGITEATCPLPYPAASGKKVLTMDFLEGVPLVDLEGIKKYSSNPEATLIAALRTWAASVVDNDIFHADVHGGNLLVLRDGRVGFIDFGIVGKISRTVWTALGDLVQSFIAEDFNGVAKALVQMGATDGSVDISKFGRELEQVVKKITQIQPDVLISTSSDGSMLNAQIAIDERETTEIVLQIVGVAESNGLKLPREFGLLLKQALYFDRYQKLLAPSLDPLRDSRVRETLKDEEFYRTKGPRGRFGGGGNVIDVEQVQ